MKFDWRKLSWKAASPLLTSGLQSLIIKAIGPVGWALKAVPYIVKGIKPFWDMGLRKIKKAIAKRKGKQEAKEIRDVSEDNVDDIYDRL